MWMGEPQTSVVPIRCGDQVVGYQHVVSVVLPRRRYRPDVRPVPCDGSPSRIGVDPEERHGALLWVSRVSVVRAIEPEQYGELRGELVEAWVACTAWMRMPAD